jgi:hypothetical protein
MVLQNCLLIDDGLFPEQEEVSGIKNSKSGEKESKSPNSSKDAGQAVSSKAIGPSAASNEADQVASSEEAGSSGSFQEQENTTTNKKCGSSSSSHKQKYKTAKGFKRKIKFILQKKGVAIMLLTENWDSLKDLVRRISTGKSLTLLLLSFCPGLFVGAILFLATYDGLNIKSIIAGWVIFFTSLIGSVFYIYVYYTQKKLIQSSKEDVINLMNNIENGLLKPEGSI